MPRERCGIRARARSAPPPAGSLLRTWLRAAGVEFEDVAPPLQPDNGSWSPIELQACQEAALSDLGRQARANALDRFRRGTLRTPVSACDLNEGRDVSDAAVAIVLAGRSGSGSTYASAGCSVRPKASAPSSTSW